MLDYIWQAEKWSICLQVRDVSFLSTDNVSMSQAYYLSSHWYREKEQTSTSKLLTLGYGYCFALGYNAPVNRGITMLGTKESFIIRKASLSPSGDHQWAIWECRSSSKTNKCYLKTTVEMWAQWPTNICPRNHHCTCIFCRQCAGLHQLPW
jgi:hypothetical protein